MARLPASMKRRTTAFFVACGIAVAAPCDERRHVVGQLVDDQRREVERIVDQLDELEERADILAEEYVVAVDEKNQLDDRDRRGRGPGRRQGGRARDAAGRSRARSRCGRSPAPAPTCSDPLFSNAAAYSEDAAARSAVRVALNVGTATTDDLDALIADLDGRRADLADKPKRPRRSPRRSPRRRRRPSS